MPGVLERVKTIGEYRDAALVLISVDYLLGYFSWSFYAAKNDLGLVPALDTQYLVAGVLPTVILGVGISLVVLHVQFSRWTGKEPSPRRNWWGTSLGFAGLGLIVVGLVTGTVIGDRADTWGGVVTIVGGYATMLGAVFQGPRGVKWFRTYGLIVLWVIVAATPLVLLLFYAERVFPSVPASLGGPAPRCVYVDLVTDSVSSSTVTELVSTEPPVALPVTGVRRTRQVDLLFTGPEFVMIRRADQRPRGPVHSLAKDAIRALTPCTSAR
jgi:hypothetical protein